MGCHAPSAAAVYRYALRLDGPRSLSDRFGLSIVFINDSSRACREFLRIAPAQSRQALCRDNNAAWSLR